MRRFDGKGGFAMKRGFTLIEMLVVVVVLVTLMMIMFKIAGIGEDNERRTATVIALQRVENCLSGYYAAFGSYPPVKLHGSRDIYREVDEHGIQQKTGGGSKNLNWAQVQAACRSQPVACRFPFPAGFEDFVNSVSDEMARRAGNLDVWPAYEPRKDVWLAKFDDGYSQNPNRHSPNKDKIDWSNIQLFKFGLMSFLLPRYSVMTRCGPVFMDYAQWTANNELPCDPFTGGRYSSWQQLQNDALSSNQRDQARVMNIPSQAVCARWMPNLEGLCSGNSPCHLFGIDIVAPGTGDCFPDNVDLEVFTPGGSKSYSNQYVLDGYTIRDGWGNELFYYSPAPYQKYTLWSAGPNFMTFPPWVSRNELTSSDNKIVGNWIADDIVHLSN